MNQRTRPSDPALPEHGTPTPTPQQARSDVDALLQAADEAINRVLSKDSQRFLEESRQHGGQ
jgi:hypothetical protein